MANSKRRRPGMLAVSVGMTAVLAPGCGPYAEAVLMNLWWGLPGLISGGFQGVFQWISGALINALFTLIS